MKKPILIIGGGIAGLTTAQVFERLGIDYLVFEAVAEIKALGAGITLAGNAMNVMEKLGLAEAIKYRGHLLRSLIIQDSSGKLISKMETEPFRKKYGMYNVAIHRADLHAVLLDALPKQKLITGKRAVQATEFRDGIRIAFDDGSQFDGAAVVVADGIHSPIRKRLLPDSEPRYAGYTCWRGITEDQWKLQGEAFEHWGKEGRFGYVPIGANQVYWFACKNAPEKDSRMKNATIQDLQKVFSSFTQPVPDIIASTPASALIWNDIVDLKPLRKFAFGNIVFIGDAAHATTPNLGQGACQAVEDADCLGALIKGENTSLAEIFRHFEHQRLRRVQFIVNTSHRLGKVAQWDHRLLISIRNALFRMLPDRVNYRQAEKVLGVE